MDKIENEAANKATERIIFPLDEDILDPCRDNVFKAMLTKETPESREALTGLLSGLVGYPVTVISIFANEPAAVNITDRQIRFDINCRSQQNERINIEMNYQADAFETLRMEYYCARLHAGQEIPSRESYRGLVPTYQISIMAHGKLFDDADLVHEFQYYDVERQQALKGKTRIISVELQKIKRIIEKKSLSEMSSAERWAAFLLMTPEKADRELVNRILAEEEAIAMAGKTLLGISRNEEERARLESEYKYAMDMQSRMVESWREGHEEGEHQKAQEVARKALIKGLRIDLIAELSGLSIEEVEQLQREMPLQ